MTTTRIIYTGGNVLLMGRHEDDVQVVLAVLNLTEWVALGRS